MNIEIEKPLELMLELTYLNAKIDKELPEMKAINNLMMKIKAEMENL